MSSFTTPDLLLPGLLNTNSLRQNKYFLFLKISAIFVSKLWIVLQTKPLNGPSYAWILLHLIFFFVLCLIYDTVSDSYRYCIWLETSVTYWNKIPSTLNEKGKPKQTQSRHTNQEIYPYSCEHSEMGINHCSGVGT